MCSKVSSLSTNWLRNSKYAHARFCGGAMNEKSPSSSSGESAFLIRRRFVTPLRHRPLNRSKQNPAGDPSGVFCISFQAISFCRRWVARTIGEYYDQNSCPSIKIAPDRRSFPPFSRPHCRTVICTRHAKRKPPPLVLVSARSHSTRPQRRRISRWIP